MKKRAFILCILILGSFIVSAQEEIETAKKQLDRVISSMVTARHQASVSERGLQSERDGREPEMEVDHGEYPSARRSVAGPLP